MKTKYVAGILSAVVLLAGCHAGPVELTEEATIQPRDTSGPLPYLGEHDVQLRVMAGGERVPDTVYYTVPKFSFINQDSTEFTQRNYGGIIYVADFFFTTCPSICPVMSAQMSRIQDILRADSLLGRVKLLSHSVDPEHDTPSVLKAYGEKLGADFRNWNFLTGPKEEMYDHLQNGYKVTALPSESAPGGILHTDQFLLIDGQRHIRGTYDGTSTSSVDVLIEDIKRLVRETTDTVHVHR